MADTSSSIVQNPSHYRHPEGDYIQHPVQLVFINLGTNPRYEYEICISLSSVRVHGNCGCNSWR